jgi:hypothetical protein
MIALLYSVSMQSYGYKEKSDKVQYYNIRIAYLNEGYNWVSKRLHNRAELKYLDSLRYDFRSQGYFHLDCVPNGTTIDVARDIKRLGIFGFFISWEQMSLIANQEVKKEVSKWKQYFNLIHKGAEVYSGAYIEPGAVIMEKASVFEDAIIERNAIVKSGVICNARIMEDIVVDAGNACVRGVISSDLKIIEI